MWSSTEVFCYVRQRTKVGSCTYQYTHMHAHTHGHTHTHIHTHTHTHTQLRHINFMLKHTHIHGYLIALRVNWQPHEALDIHGVYNKFNGTVKFLIY